MSDEDEMKDELIDLSEFVGHIDEDTSGGNEDVRTLQRSFSQKQVGSIAEFVEPVSALSSIDDIIDIFEDCKAEALPVEEYDRVVGIIERRDVQEATGTTWKRFTAGNVSEYTKRVKEPLRASDFIELTLGRISEVSRDSGVRHFPVFNGRSFFGMVSLESFLERIAEIRQQDLTKAAAIQQSYFPGNANMASLPYRVMAWNRMANELGGDFYQVHQVEGGGSAVCCFDVSGKNVAASLLTMAVGSYFKMLTMKLIDGTALKTPKDVVAALDDYLARSVPAGNFITAMMCFVDKEGKVLHLFNCGHTMTYLIFTDGEHKGHIASMPPALPPLGMGAVRDAIQKAASKSSGTGMTAQAAEKKPWTVVKVSAGLHISIYSDGFTDMKDDRGERYEDERAKRFFVRLSVLPDEDIREAISEEVDEWIKGSMIPDDITVLDVRF